MADSDTNSKPSSILKQEPEGCASPSSYLGMNYTTSPRNTPKTVSIDPNAETISPMMLGNQKNVDNFELEEKSSKRPLQKRVNSKRLTGRSNISPQLKPVTPQLDGNNFESETSPSDVSSRHMKNLDSLVDGISAWIKDEKAKKSRKHAAKKQSKHGRKHHGFHLHRKDRAAEEETATQSEESDGSTDLDRLENILKQNLSLGAGSRKPSYSSQLRPRPSVRNLHRRKRSTASSDTDYFEGDVLVPSCDATLDNSKTMSYSGKASDTNGDSSDDEGDRVVKDKDAWGKFKFEIVRLTHTLRLKGWRRVPMTLSEKIEVQRLSGALTNAVYVVTPPNELPEDGPSTSKKAPQKLLLRIYGPQVEHLIDREEELQILRRLARKRIGPRLLGTFANGRFEEFFHAETLTHDDLHNPDTSKQIAKRMRELHFGIELLDSERDAGPFIWRNWDKWVARVEQVVCWLDEQVLSQKPGEKPSGDDAWKRRGLICGVKWPVFKKTVEKYREYLNSIYGGPKEIKERLVFAHNDTQYGNILRLTPGGESPLLLPANTHKRLVVIDFEYANANLPGLEFANHFTEWCYNYHEERKPYACKTELYPNPNEQERFIRSYVQHKPALNASTPKLTPMAANITTSSTTSPALSDMSRRPTTSISEFMLDARNPYFPTVEQQTGGSSTGGAGSDDGAAAEDAEVKHLLAETRLWRLANTAQWVAWGIVQAKVPGMPDFDGSDESAAKTTDGDIVETPVQESLGERADEYRELIGEHEAAKDFKSAVETRNVGGASGSSEVKAESTEGEDELEEEFDYLGYAQHRAMFFWGDALQLGLVGLEDLPDEVRGKVKTVPY